MNVEPKNFKYVFFNLCLDLTSKILNITIKKRKWKTSNILMKFRKKYIIKYIIK
jgi:hypothetical protein